MVSRVRYASCVIFFIGLCHFAFTQMPRLATVTPVSPNAASLGKYGEIPVGYYTGIPSISVPVYDINTGFLSLPINLSYHAGGVKVEEVASWVGIGWSLNAGGVISRQIRGLPDETGVGYLNTKTDVERYVNNQMSSVEKKGFITDLNDNIRDGQQDIFVYNFGGESGKFFFGNDGQVNTIPVSKNKFELGTFEGYANTWKVTDQSGTKYYFTVKETTEATPVNNGQISNTGPPVAPTSWYISKIVNALNTDSIVFVYEGTFSQYETIQSETKYLLNGSSGGYCGFKPSSYSYSLNSTIGARLSQIQYRNGSVHFIRNTETRCDFPTDYALSSIEIRNTDNSLYKKFVLNQSYMTTNTQACDKTNWRNSRLFLDGITIMDDANSIGNYAFEYDKSHNLPSTNSFNQDHWGYFNGASNSTLVPTTNIIRGAPTDIVILSGADRNPNTVFTQTGIIKSITYPTGGKTEFQFENNKVYNMDPTDDIVSGYGSLTFNGSNTYTSTSFTVGDYAGMGGTAVSISVNMGSVDCGQNQGLGCPIVTIDNVPVIGNVTRFLAKGNHTVIIDLTGVDQSIRDNFGMLLTWVIGSLDNDAIKNQVTVGGLRVKKITDYNADGTKAAVKKYEYQWPGQTNYASGNLLNFPKYIGDITYTNQNCTYYSISSSSTYPLSMAQGSYVQYKYVQEYLGENGEFGKNTYEFAISSDLISHLFPFPPATTLEFERGQLLNQVNYRYNSLSQSYTPTSEKINEYLPGNGFMNFYQGIKVGENIIHDEEFFVDREFVVSQYNTQSGWNPLVKTTEKVYDQNNPSLYTLTTHDIGYGTNHYFPISDVTKNSKGEIMTSKMKYPLDYPGLTSSSNVALGIKKLIELNNVSPVIESIKEIKNADGSNARVKEAVFSQYKTDKPLADIVSVMESNAPSSSFVQSSVSAGDIVKSSLYAPKIVFESYDATGNISQQRKIDDISMSYLWDYKNQYPVAEVSNGLFTEIGYSSFEGESTGRWQGLVGGSIKTDQGAVTGSKSYQLDQNGLSVSGLPSKDRGYMVSYWSRGGTVAVNGSTSRTAGRKLTIAGVEWTYYQVAVASGVTSVTITGTGVIDELRLYPAAAMMTTYTYIPQVGVQTKCDVNNMISYYEYDKLGRLLLIRDDQRNIIKSFQYQYQVPVQ